MVGKGLLMLIFSSFFDDINEEDDECKVANYFGKD